MSDFLDQFPSMEDAPDGIIIDKSFAGQKKHDPDSIIRIPIVQKPNAIIKYKAWEEASTTSFNIECEEITYVEYYERLGLIRKVGT